MKILLVLAILGIAAAEIIAPSHEWRDGWPRRHLAGDEKSHKIVGYYRGHLAGDEKSHKIIGGWPGGW